MTGDIVTYTIRIFNEGRTDGYANEITDDMPEGLEFLPENETNVEYRWKMLDEDQKPTTDVSKAKYIVTDYLSEEQEKEAARQNKIKAFNKEGEITETNPDHKEVQIAFKVTYKAKTTEETKRTIINTAQISKDSDDDIDSKPNRDEVYDHKNGENEDDIDYDQVKVKYFDLSLLKWVGQTQVTLNGKTVTTNTGHNASNSKNEPAVKIEIKASDVKKIKIKYIYTIRVTNEGEIEGYAKESVRNARIRVISEHIEKSPDDIMTGSIIVLPKSENKDAKDLLRCGFAMANRVTQFINPSEDDEGNQYKIKNVIYDLLRQFGYSKQPTTWKKLPEYPVIAIDAASNITSMSGKKVRSLPMMLRFNAEDRMITVESPAMNNGLPMPYYKACLELCKLSMNRDCDSVCNEATKRYIEQKMKGLENVYRYKDAIVVVSGDGFIRSELWPGISNRKIETYSFLDRYCPESIDVGSKILSVSLNFSNSKLRIVRIRCNNEVPDYYLMNEDSVSGNADGIYLYRYVFYASTSEKSVDMTYRGDKENSILHPQNSYRCKSLIEYYPLNLCNEDEPSQIINYLNELRGLSPQFNKVTNLPLPLHYLDKIKEYLSFDLD